MNDPRHEGTPWRRLTTHDPATVWMLLAVWSIATSAIIVGVIAVMWMWRAV